MEQAISKSQVSAILKTVIALCRNNLEMASGQAVNKYLKEERKLSQKTIDAFQLGAFPPVKTIQSRLSNSYIAWKLGLLSFDDDGKVVSKFSQNQLIIPIMDPYGDPIAIMGRVIVSETDRETLGVAKYVNTIYAKSRNLFGLFENKSHILAQGNAIIVEGNFDVITAWQHGVNNVVATSSAELGKYQFCLLSRYTDNGNLLFDADAAGQKGTEKALKRFGAIERFDIKGVSLPQDVKDLDEFFVSGGKHLTFL